NASRVIIYHHGLPSCRLELEVYKCTLQQRPGVRMIALDRPGIGRSSPQSCASILSWPADLAAFADALGIHRFAIAATSAGTRYPLAGPCAMRDRVAAVSLACPMAPLEAVGHRTGGGPKGVTAATNHQFLAALVLGRQARMARRNPDRHPFTDMLLPQVDKA